MDPPSIVRSPACSSPPSMSTQSSRSASASQRGPSPSSGRAEPSGSAIPNDLTVLACPFMDPRRRFTGKRALVTGAGSGIGEAVARKLHAEGAEVVLADVRAEPVEAIAAELDQTVSAEVRAGDAGGRASAAQLDVRKEDAVRELTRDVDVLTNVAGIGSTTTAPETPLAVWEDVFAVNSRGTFLCCKHAIPGMVERGGGSIVNVASVAGLIGLRNRAAYCASKGAVIALTRALAVDHVADGVRVNAVCPGTVDSPWVRRLVEEVGESLDALRARQPMGRLGTPEEIAEAVLYLASDHAAFVTGTAFAIDGGLTAA
jgi:meso-butanediol dehydrogenase / (S,S)-butanediol dehydrogenase / diacetyl reductase